MKPVETTKIVDNEHLTTGITSEMPVQQVIDYFGTEYEEDEIFVLDFTNYFVDYDDYPIFELCEIDDRQRKEIAQMVILDKNRLTIII